jgi:catechol 2,3-dioxygenase-like lactoylglutathione lyase family enzyme
MPSHAGLSQYNIIGFATIVDVARAKEFYGHTLGLRLIGEEPPFALVFDAHGIMLRLGMGKELPPARWWARRDSNPGPPRCKRGALTN